MTQTLAMLFTISGLVETFARLCDELLPGVARINIADEAVLRLLLDNDGITPAVTRRVAEDVISAETAGADLVLLTCSSISPCADTARSLVGIPVLKIDEPMVDQAIASGRRIGVAATATTTLKPTSQLIESRSRILGRETVVDPVLCRGAYAALMAGDMQEHDRIVGDYLRRMMDTNDVIVLAQASMARVAEGIPAADRRVPILASPRLAVERAAAVLAELAGGEA
jgi:Asp/Glu/hydantoin racemase